MSDGNRSEGPVLRFSKGSRRTLHTSRTFLFASFPTFLFFLSFFTSQHREFQSGALAGVKG
jgi:hypothetical protein